MKEPYFPEPSARFAQAVESLFEQRVVVLGHRRPDGDCIGSQVALVRCLRALGVDAIAVNPDPIPRTLQNFVGDTPFQNSESLPEGEVAAIYVDCSDRERSGLELAERFPNPVLNVDHHVSNEGFAATDLVISDASATGEILAGFFFDNEYPVDAVTAQALYLGIATDTGQFRYRGANQRVFRICERLCGLGASPADAANELYEREKPGRIQLLQRFLASFRYECEGRVCIGMLDPSVYEETDTLPEDSENLVDYARSLEGVDVGALIEERDGMIKGSLRAKENRFRVDLLAKKFNGGGHACAAGFNLDGTLSEFYPTFTREVEAHLAQVDEGSLDQ
jgi:phosphoesterase RecJ-like protein